MLIALCALLTAFASSASASKQAVDFFGGSGTLGGQFESPEDVAVNYSGAGGVPAGTIYATDGGNLDVPSQRGNRVERFQRDDNGTPAETADDTYSFVAAWGAGVLSGGSDYEICTVAASCQKGTGQGGNGTVAGDGSLNKPGGIAVDEDTGNVYVTDGGSLRTHDNHHRVNVYSATGTFLRSFGWGVVESGPDDNGTGYEICVAANGDVCEAGTEGSGLGQLGSLESGERSPEGIAISPPDGNPATGTVFVADQFNRRINTYKLDGTSPGSIGSAAQFATNQPEHVAVDSRGILYADNEGPIARYDTTGVDGPVGFLAPIAQGVNEVQKLTVSATAGTFNLSFEGDTTADLPFNAEEAAAESALEALPSIPSASAVRVNGGPGDASGSNPYNITFQSALGAKDVPQVVAANGTTPLSGGAGVSVVTTTPGQSGLIPGSESLAVEPDPDGGGPKTDVLYAGRQGGAIQQFGPLNSPGLLAPPTSEDERHGTSGAFQVARGLAVEPSTGRLYAAGVGKAGPGVYVLDNAGPPPTATLDSLDNVTSTSADLHATIDPNGPPATRYHLEYSTDGVKWLSTPEVLVGAQETPQAITAHLEPLPIGLAPNTFYHVRLVAGRNLATPIVTGELTFTTLGAPPLAETAGAPVRTTTTAQLNGHVTPMNSATTYRFEYGTDESYGQSTPSMPAGSGELTELVAEEIEGLTPDTTYHYRLVAENGVGSPAMGADMTVHTRASDELPNQSDKFPGPPGSDRAWEQVSIADSSGNPVGFSEAFSDDGNRAVYGIFGGTPISSTGSLTSLYFAQRTPSGWQSSLITPPRDQLAGQFWWGVNGPSDLHTMITLNNGADSGLGEAEIWRLTPGSGPTLLYQRVPIGDIPTESFGVSADGSRVLAFLSSATTAIDPAYPAASSTFNVYDVSSATPQLVSLLPGNVVSPCGEESSTAFKSQDSHWVSADGSLAYFQSSPVPPCGGGAVKQLYVRDLLAEQTKLISGPPFSGPDNGGSFIKAVPGAAFFATTSRLDPADSGSGNDVYRYDVGDDSLKCVTCVIPGFSVDVEGSDPAEIAVSDDGSHVYFTTRKRLLPGAPPDGQRAVYRVDVGSGALAYVAQIGGRIGTAQPTAELTPDGSTLAFSSNLASLNPLGGVSDNGGTIQYYRYSDAGRSLVCATCPQDGSPPVGGLNPEFHRGTGDRHTLSEDGQTLAFATPTPLLGADQNTAGPGHSLQTGTDVYEWRDGRLILVTDGLTNWTEEPATKAVKSPAVEGIAPSGSDVYFTATAAYTPDAPDALNRLYDARIGGGISFPKPPPPCPLEVCQGTPKGAPEEQEPASRNFSGQGNATPPKASRCPKGKRRVKSRGKTRCVAPRKPHHHRAAKHNRRAHR